MTQRNANCPDEEPVQRKFEKPSEGAIHLFQVVEELDQPDPDVAVMKCEVCGGDEEGRSLLHRVSLDSEWKGFFNTRLFLKVIGEPYKGKIRMDSDNWIGRQFPASVIHNTAPSGKVYANIDEYDFENMVEQVNTTVEASEPREAEAAWDENK